MRGNRPFDQRLRFASGVVLLVISSALFASPAFLKAFAKLLVTRAPKPGAVRYAAPFEVSTLFRCNEAEVAQHVARVELSTYRWGRMRRSNLPAPWSDVPQLRSFRECLSQTGHMPFGTVISQDQRLVTWTPGRNVSTPHSTMHGGGVECVSNSIGPIAEELLSSPTIDDLEWVWGDTAMATMSVDDVRLALKHAEVALIGDSLTRQQFYSLCCLLDMFDAEPKRIHYLSVDMISQMQHYHAEVINSSDIVLFGIGHHMDRSKDFHATYEEILDTVFNYAAARRREGAAMWVRTRCPRHYLAGDPQPPDMRAYRLPGDTNQPPCHNFTGPATNLTYAVLNRFDATGVPFMNCQLHKRHQAMLVKGRKDVRLLDTEALSFFRPDQHNRNGSVYSRGSQGKLPCDLSHYCYAGSAPSVPDTWNILWLNRIVADWKKQDRSVAR